MSKNGFTLIELMIVVAIVGIIAAVVFPAYQSYMHGDNTAGIGQMRSVQSTECKDGIVYERSGSRRRPSQDSNGDVVKC